ncbi:MAG: aminotransferase class I/II-fold pyridoxal phosphate-dependent enzyme [Alphaproteobacteria bacterium]|nr:MAG: aminotransferase class I/II-fold pyridoxal phosphate-dependent enzyme [Alphaproteobacteria bacterium]
MTAMIPPAYITDAGPQGMPGAERPLDLIDLSLNESRFGASPLAVAAAAARAQRLSLYPDPASTDLRAALARHTGFEPEMLVCGNGSEELLDVLVRLHCRPGDEVLIDQHGFIGFHLFAMRSGARLVRAPDRAMTTDVDALVAAITPRTRVIFLANPNNPTGTWIPAADLARLVAAVPSTIVLVIDSAYAEYVDGVDYDDGARFVAGRENVVMARTFSKAYGLAAVRVGWCYASARMVRLINRVRGVGNVNALAQAAAIAALSDQDHLAAVRRATAAARTQLREGLTRLGCHVWPSVTNFLLVRLPEGCNRSPEQIAASLLADHNILIRPTTDYGITQSLRITVGTAAENETLLAGVAQVLLSAA